MLQLGSRPISSCLVNLKRSRWSSVITFHDKAIVFTMARLLRNRARAAYRRGQCWGRRCF